MPIEKTNKIWMDGSLVDWENATVHVLTHALHYGTAVFEGIRGYKTKNGTSVFRLTDHIRRLHRSAKVILMDIPFSVEELVEATKETIRSNPLSEAPLLYIRPLAYFGYGEFGLNPLANPVKVSIAAFPWGTYLGEEGVSSGIRVKTSSWQRIDMNAMPPQAKTSAGYLNSVLAKTEVIKSGYDEALFINPQGTIAEGPGENFFMVRDGVIITPTRVTAGLSGITRESIITIATDLGYEVREEGIARADAYLADEAFFTGTAAELTPIREIDDRVVGTGKPGPITQKLQETYFAAARAEIETYREWCEFV
ncbi:MAG: branched-chain amino acid transaminase [Actinomycetota bacterium]